MKPFSSPADKLVDQQELIDFSANAPIALNWIAEDGRILWANRAELDLLGYTREEYIAHHTSEFHVDADVIADILQRLSRHETLHNYEARLRRKDGTIRYVLISSSVHRKKGKFMHTHCLTRDITERKRTEAALRQWEHMSNHADWAVALADPVDHTLLFADPTFAAMHGYTVEELIGKPVADLFAPETRSHLPEHIDALRQHGHHVFESLHLRKDGICFPALTHVTAFKDHDGSIRYRATFQDLTDQKGAERERERLVAAVHEKLRQLHATQRVLEEELHDLETVDDVGGGT